MPRTNSKYKPSTREPVVNPYQAFTAPEFDSWIAKLTGTLQAALQGSETLAPHSVQWKDTEATRLIGNGLTSNLLANASAYTKVADADTVGVVEDVSFELREEDGSLAASETSVSEDTVFNELSGALESHLGAVDDKKRETVHGRRSANSETPIALDQPHQDLESVSLQKSAPSDAPVILDELKTASKLERSPVVKTPPVKISTSAKISWGMAGSTKRDDTTQDLAPTFSLGVASVPHTPRLPHKETPVAKISLFDLPPRLGGQSSLSANTADKLSFTFQGSAHARIFTDRIEHVSSDIRAHVDEAETMSEDGMEQDGLQSDSETASEGIQLRRHQEVQTNTDYTTEESDSDAIQSDGEEDEEEVEEGGEDDDGREREYYGQMGDKYSYSSEEPQDYSEGDVQEYGQDQVVYDDEEEYESSNDELPPSRENSGVSSVREEDGILILDSSDEEEDDRVDSRQENSNQARTADLEKEMTEENEEEYEEEEENKEEEYDEEYEDEFADDDQQFATKQAHLSPRHAMERYLPVESPPSEENLSFDDAGQPYVRYYHGGRSNYSSESEDDELPEAPETSLAALASLYRQYSTQPLNERSHADQSQFSRMADLAASAQDTFGKDSVHGAVLEPSSLEQEADHPTSLAAEGQELSEADLHLQEMEEYYLLQSPKDAAILEEEDEEEEDEEDCPYRESHNQVTHGEEMSDDYEDDEVSVEAHNDIDQEEETGVHELPVVASEMEEKAVQEVDEKQDVPADSLQQKEQSHLSEVQGAELSNMMTPESQPGVESMGEDNLKLSLQSLATPLPSQFASITRSETTVDFATPDTLQESGMDYTTTMDLIADEYLQTPGSEESTNEVLGSEIESGSVEQGQEAALEEGEAMSQNEGALTTPAQVKEAEDTSDDIASVPGGANSESRPIYGEDAEHQAEEFSEHERRVHYRSPGVVKYLVDYYDKIIQSEAASAAAQGGILSDEQEARGGQGDAVKDAAASTTGGERIVSLQGKFRPSPTGKRHDSVLSPANRSQKRKRTTDSRDDDASAATPNRKSTISTTDREMRSQKRRTSDLSPQTPSRSLRSRGKRSTTPTPKAKRTHLDANVTPGSERSFFDARSHVESDGEDENTAFSNAPDTVSTNMLHSLISKHDCNADHNELLAILNDGRIDQENDTSSSTPEEDLHVFWMFEDEKSEGEHDHHHHHPPSHNGNSERKSGVQSSYYLRSKCPLRKLILARRGGEKQYYVGKGCWIEQEGASTPQESPRKRKREPSIEDVKSEKATREDEHRFEDVKLEGTPTILDHIAPDFLRSAKKVNRHRRSSVAQDKDGRQASSPSPTPSRTASTGSSTQAGDANKNPKPKPTRRSSRLASEELKSVSDDDQEELLNAPPPALSTRSHAKSHGEVKELHEKMPTSTAPSTPRKKQTRRQQEPKTPSKPGTNRVLRHHR